MVTAIERWAVGGGLIAQRRRCDPLRLAAQREQGIRLRTVGVGEQRAARGRTRGLRKASAARSTTASLSTSPSFRAPTIRKNRRPKHARADLFGSFPPGGLGRVARPPIGCAGLGTH